MARSSTERASGRIAVLGAQSPAGAAIKSALADRPVSGDRVALYGHQREIAVLSEYDGEARLVQAADELEPGAYGAVFVCDRGHDAAKLTEAAASGTLVVDMTGTLPAGRGVITIPQPITLMLTSLLAPLRALGGLARASIFVLRPSSDFGEPGLEELREQTVRLLRFEPIPTEVFGRQLAFNVLPEKLFPEDEHDAASQIVGECRALLSSPELPLTLSLALVPLFFGHAIAAHVDLSEPAAGRAMSAWRGASGIEVSEDLEAGATLDAPEGERLLVTRVDESGSSLRIWAVGAEGGSWAAARALAAAADVGVL